VRLRLRRAPAADWDQPVRQQAAPAVSAWVAGVRPERGDVLAGEEGAGLGVVHHGNLPYYLDIELLDVETLVVTYLDVKSFDIKLFGVAATTKQERDHIDRFLESIRDTLPMLDPEVEGLVDRISGLSRRFHRALDETLREFELDYAEWKLLGLLARRSDPYHSSPGQLARMMELSSGAMTNRLDRLEHAGLLRRLPDPGDRRAIQVEVTDAGRRLYEDAVGVQAKKESLVAAALSKTEKKQLNALLRRLMLEFERAEGGPPA
jgi:DNA-binding MarR family transcriptional regulator